jgi:DNA-binding SARP family transcriptional activator
MTTSGTIGLLGPFTVSLDLTTVTVDWSARRLLAFLGIEVHPVSRERAAGTLWPDEPAPVAAARLRTSLWRLRSHLPSTVDVVGDSMTVAPTWQVDYRSACDLAERMAKNPATDPADIPQWRMFTEDLLPDWYEPWLEPAQRAFRETRIHALEWIARRRLQQGEHWLAIEACGAALTAEPLRQSAHELMAEIYRAEGNQILALRHLEDTRRFLEAQLN